jgi:fucose permease
MAWALFALLAMLALVPLIPSLWLLILVILLIGFTSAILDVGGNILLMWIHGSRVGPFMSGLHFCFGLGALISPLIVAQVLRMGGQVQWTYWIIALLIVSPALVILRKRSPEIPAHSEDGKSAGDAVFVLLMAFFFFLHVGAEISFGGWIFTYAVKMDLADRAVAAYLTSLFWGSLTLGRLLGVPIAALANPRVILIGDLSGCLIGVGILLFLSQSQAALWGGTALLGLSIASIFPTSFTFAERHLPMSGKITSWFLIGASLGGMFLPWFIGQLFERIGPRVTMGILLIDVFAGLAVVLVLLRYATHRRKSPYSSTLSQP